MYLAIIVLPLLGSIVSGFFGRKVGVSGAQLVTCLSITITTILGIVAFFEVGLNNISVSIQLCRWIDTESLNVQWSFNFDSLTVSMLIPVLIISLLVHVYSIGYMSNDPHNQRFYSYLSLFTFMMIVLVTANNFLLMFVGWEGVGVCSYLLVNFWFTRIAANQSSISAFLTNRVGDCFLTIGIFALLWTFGNIDYSTVFSLAPFVSENVVTVIGICLLIGAMAKSSQIGLHVWLPQAMEGPTPVSALIHAATMVTAGVYLLLRTSPLVEYSSTVLILTLWVGAITTVFSSLIGLFQQDIKKVIAYSTMSQLGMMVIAIGLSSYNIALYHLVNHAFYKALLFLGAGAIIHAWADNQDFRKYGGLRPFLPLTYSVMLIASFSLVALPFMTGFYSKDFILESAYGQFYFSSTVVYIIATLGAILTTLYSVKVLYLTFLTNPNGPLINYKQVHEGDIYMNVPLIILALFSIFFGYITKDLFIGLASGFFSDNSLFIHPTHEIMLDTEFAVPSLFKLLPLALTVSVTIISLVLFEFLANLLVYLKFTWLGYNIFSFFNKRFFIELFYNKYITGLIFKLGGQTTKLLDKGSVELLGPYGLEKGLINFSKNIASLDVGIVTSYALYILIGLISYILIPYIYSDNNSLLFLIFFALFAIVLYYNTDSIVFKKNIEKHSSIIIKSEIMPNFTLSNDFTIINALVTITIISATVVIRHLIQNRNEPKDDLTLEEPKLTGQPLEEPKLTGQPLEEPKLTGQLIDKLRKAIHQFIELPIKELREKFVDLFKKAIHELPESFVYKLIEKFLDVFKKAIDKLPELSVSKLIEQLVDVFIKAIDKLPEFSVSYLIGQLLAVLESLPTDVLEPLEDIIKIPIASVFKIIKIWNDWDPMFYVPVNTDFLVYSVPNVNDTRTQLLDILAQAMSNQGAQLTRLGELLDLIQSQWRFTQNEAQARLLEQEGISIREGILSSFDVLRDALVRCGRIVLADPEFRRTNGININPELVNPMSGLMLRERYLGDIITGQEVEFLPRYFNTFPRTFNLYNINLNNTEQLVNLINSFRYGLGLQPLTLDTIQIHLNSDFSEAANELRRLFWDLPNWRNRPGHTVENSNFSRTPALDPAENLDIELMPSFFR